ncbi:hypothetical protein N2152v2_010406 [Parachlorella kessleri]
MWDMMLEAAEQTTGEQGQVDADSLATIARQDLSKALKEEFRGRAPGPQQWLRFNVQHLAGLEALGCSMRSEADRAVAHSGCAAWLACDSQAVVPIAYSRLGQLRLDWLTVAAEEVARFQARFPEQPRWASESFFLALVGPWLIAASTALVSLPQAPTELRDVLRGLAARYARYLVSCSTLSNVPAISAKEARFGYYVTTAAVLPLVNYAEAQLLLRESEGSWDVDALFAPSLAVFFAVGCLATRLQDIPLRERHLLYRAIHRLNDHRAMVLHMSLGGMSSSAEGSMPPVSKGTVERVRRMSDTVARMLAQHKQGNLRSQEEWTGSVKQLFDRVSALLLDEATTQAEALLHEHSDLLQEPILTTLACPVPAWTELGGPELVAAATTAGAINILRRLEDWLAGGPYTSCVYWPWTKFVCHVCAGNVEEVVRLVEEEAGTDAGERPGLPLAEVALWRNLGVAYCCTYQQGPAKLDPSASLHPMALKAVSEMVSIPSVTPLLPDFTRSLAASASWPDTLACEAFTAMLETGQAAAALKQMGQLAAGRLCAGKSVDKARSPAEQQGLALQLGRLLLERPASETTGLLVTLSDLPAEAAGPAACLLASLTLERGDAHAAWQLLRSVLAAACRHDPSMVLLCVQAMYKAGAWQEVGEACDAIRSCKSVPAGTERQFLRLAALSEAHRGEAEKALELAAELSAGALAEVADLLLKQQYHLSTQAAERCIVASEACGRASTTAALYRGLTSSQLESLPVRAHAAAARAFLLSAQSSNSSGKVTASVEAALELLQRHAVPLRFRNDNALAGLACDAAVSAMQGQGWAVQQGIGKVLAILAVAVGEAETQTLSQNLLPPVRLFLWGLKMLHEAGAAPAKLRGKLEAAVTALDAAGKSGQLLGLLRAVPGWAPGMKPAAPHWGTLLCAARRDAESMSDGEVQLDASVARQLGSICSELKRVYGPAWIDKLGSSASQIAVKAVGEALSDYSLVVDAWAALTQRKTLPQASLQQGCLGKQEVSDESLDPAEDLGFDLALCKRLVEGWQRQLAAAASKPAPTSAAAAEALAVLRMLDLLQYKAGWKALGDLAETWGQPPSSYAVLAVLRALDQQCWQASESVAASSPESPAPDSILILSEVLEATPRIIGDLAASPAAPPAAQQAASSGSNASSRAPTSPTPPEPARSRWPALDPELTEAALELLLACNTAAPAAQQGASSSQQLTAGVQSLLQALCRAQQPLTPEVCYLLLEAFSRDPELAAWAGDSFVCGGHTGSLLTALDEQLSGQGSAEPLLLQPRLLDKQHQADGGHDKADQAPAGKPEPGAAFHADDPEYMLAAGRRQERLEDLRRVKSWEALIRHMESHGWVLKEAGAGVPRELHAAAAGAAAAAAAGSMKFYPPMLVPRTAEVWKIVKMGRPIVQDQAATDCSDKCHKEHWKQHQKECAQLRQWRLDNRLPSAPAEGAVAKRGAARAAAQQNSSQAEKPPEAAREAGGTAEQQQQQQHKKKKHRGRSQRCGLCNNRRGPFTRTECCNKLICDDYDDYEWFSYGRNSCKRNHDTYTHCASHYHEKHAGHWKDCQKCKEDIDPFKYYHFGINRPDQLSRSNFADDVLEGPEPAKPLCSICNREVDTIMEAHCLAYCSVDCQKQHWKQHKKECAQLRQWRLANKLPKERAEGAIPLREGEAEAAQQTTAQTKEPSGAGRGANSPAAPSTTPEQQKEGQKQQKKTGGKGAGGSNLHCGLCGNRKGPFTRTPCCKKVICDDENTYQMFTYARNSCKRNHDRYTLCSYHHGERHGGHWKDCEKCKKNFHPFDYYQMGTNRPDEPSKSNFDDDVLDGPPPPKPRCATCKCEIDTGMEQHSFSVHAVHGAAIVSLDQVDYSYKGGAFSLRCQGQLWTHPGVVKGSYGPTLAVL